HGPGTAKLLEPLEPFRVLLELRMVALAELVPAFGRVPEPLAQLRARRELLQPFVERGVFLAQAARPQAVDEDSPAVRLRRRIVHALDVDPRLSSHGSPSFAARARPRPRSSISAPLRP